MEPVAKIKLVESYMEVLEAANLACPPAEEDADFVVRMAALINCMGIQLLDCWKKVRRECITFLFFVRDGILSLADYNSTRVGVVVVVFAMR